MNVNYYWKNKEERAKIAKDHTYLMYLMYPNEIKYSIKNTHIYGPEAINHIDTEGIPEITVVDETSVDAAINYHNGKTAILNFASFKNPGGRFIEGSRAQEESLCHASFLYNVLKEFPDYYKWNSAHSNRALYVNRALYSPSIVFENEKGKIVCDVITCAAPNLSWALKYQNVQAIEDNIQILEDRIRFVLQIAHKEKVETLILGAFGCGVFKQNPKVVANHFFTMLQSSKYGNIKTVFFAVPKGVDSKNYNTFCRTV